MRFSEGTVITVPVILGLVGLRRRVLIGRVDLANVADGVSAVGRAVHKLLASLDVPHVLKHLNLGERPGSASFQCGHDYRTVFQYFVTPFVGRQIKSILEDSRKLYPCKISSVKIMEKSRHIFVTNLNGFCAVSRAAALRNMVVYGSIVPIKNYYATKHHICAVEYLWLCINLGNINIQRRRHIGTRYHRESNDSQTRSDD